MVSHLQQIPGSGQVVIDKAVAAVRVIGNPFVQVNFAGVPGSLGHELVHNRIL